jgi:hypothetical protein
MGNSYRLALATAGYQSRRMMFGDRLAPARDTEPAEWLTGAVRLETGTVAGLLPTHYESYALVEPAPSQANWWEAQRRIMRRVSEVLARFTDTPERSWFAVWEGHGFDSRHRLVARQSERTDAKRAKMEAQQEALRAEDARFTVSVREALRAVPRWKRPARTYYLLSGTVADIDSIRWPGEDRWFRPDLWWPDDHAWFVGTDVDFWTTYIGGTPAMTDALTERLPERCRAITLDDELRAED